MATSSPTSNHTKLHGWEWVLVAGGAIVAYIISNLVFVLMSLMDLERLMDGGPPLLLSQTLALGSLTTFGALLGVPSILFYAFRYIVHSEKRTFGDVFPTVLTALRDVFLIACLLGVLGILVPGEF